MTIEELKRDFDAHDTDGNGHIDRPEFGRLVHTLGVNMNEDRMFIAFQAIDTDGNGTIEFGEFAAWWKRR